MQSSSLSAPHRILIVEDHQPLRSLLSFVLSRAGYEAFETADAVSAMDEAGRQSPDLVLLDQQLPDMDGLKLLRLWRADETTARIPVIMVSGKADDEDRVAGLRAGADDYVVKPFNRDELVARVQAVLRRTAGPWKPEQEIRRFGELALDVRSMQVTAADRPLNLRPIEFRILGVFMNHPERVLSRAQIVDRVWRINTDVDERTVDVHMRRLRRALKPTGHHHYLQTVRGVGYRLSRSGEELLLS